MTDGQNFMSKNKIVEYARFNSKGYSEYSLSKLYQIFNNS